MRIVERLEEIRDNDESFFRRQLAKEDLTRLARLNELAAEAPDLNTFKKEALFLGWTKGDLRTPELRSSLEPLLDILYAAIRNGDERLDQATEELIEAAWDRFHRDRFEKLIHCL